MKKIILILISLLFITGCSRDADKVSYNLSKDADNFKVRRRIVFINLRSNEYLFEIEGNCSINTDTSDKQLEVTCKVGEDKYQKHFLRLADETTYTVEQLDMTEANKYKYKIVFKPEAILPITVEGE